MGATTYGLQEAEETVACTAVNPNAGIRSTCKKDLVVIALAEITALLGEPRFNWSDPAPWIGLEQELGIEFPADFREVVDAYGSIEINKLLYLKHPAGHLLHSLGDKIRGILSSGAMRTWWSSCRVRWGRPPGN
ncbi:hypothetical protein ACFCZT_26805 [Streptomyces sp. NPDC056230]|uniref:hypothetical protein n=1 Tax=Streptomyces sp. NPDC056230 TaxID=3345754 RepID=UPI0035DC3B88